jgi:hypothetical protein
MAMFVAIRRASSFVSSLAAGLALIINVGQLLTVSVTHNETGFKFFDSPRWREAAIGHWRAYYAFSARCSARSASFS